ncbi:hypothetical protein RI129_006056 [Pyrocoelia pectoralis]|uniref:t-SNARE coiled-coil homology domain-containing protein n=1 Tax=Pyrocoelia pectoralis TaxID=417401 RepID=A0AAN7VFT0_9COLE
MSQTKDRLNDLKKIQNGEIGVSVDVESESEKQSKDINSTLNKVDQIRENIEIIRHNTLVSNSIFQSNSFKLTTDLQDQIDSLFQSTTTTSYKINKQLKELENELAKIKNKSCAEYRIKQIQCTTLKEDFRKVLGESSSSLEFHRNKRKNHLITTEEARRQLRDIEERHEELLKIEKNLEEVMNLFVTIGTLVEQQRELVDRVEYHATNATEFVDMGTKQLDKTVRAKKKWTKRKFYIIIAIIILLLILLIFFFA